MNKLLFLVINGIALLDLAIGQGSKTAWRANLGTGMQGLDAVYNALNPKQNIRRLIEKGMFTPLDLALLFTGRHEPTTPPMPGIENFLSPDEPYWAKAMRFQDIKSHVKKKTHPDPGTYLTLAPTTTPSTTSSPMPAPPTQPTTLSSTEKPETTTKSLCQLLSESKFRIFLGDNGGSSTRSITKPMPTKPAEESTMSKLKTLLDGLSASKLKAIADILKSKEPGPAPTEPSSRPPNVPSRSRSRSRPPPPPGSDNFGPPREARGRMRGPERRGPSSGPMDSRDQMRPRNGGGRNGPPPNMNGPPGGDRWGGPGGGNGRPRGGPPNAMSPQMLARLSRVLRKGMLLGPPGRGGAAASGGEAPEQPEPGTVNPMLMAFMMKQMAGGGSGAEGGAGGLGSFMGVPGANLMNMLGGSGGSGGAYMMQALGGGSGAGGGETPSGTGLGALASLAGGGGGLGGMNPAALAAMLGGASGSAGAEGGAAGFGGLGMNLFGSGMAGGGSV